MYMINTSMVLCKGFISSRGCRSGSKICSRNASICMYSSPPKRRHAHRFTHNAKNRHSRKRQPWWHKFFSDQVDETWTDWSADDVLGESDETDGNDGEEGVLEEEKFEAWKRKAEAISELREAQEDARNAEGREWENWIGDSDVNGSSWDQDWGERAELSSEGPNGPDEMMPEEGFVASIKNLIVRRDSDDLLFEDRVFLFASTSSAKFIALLVLIPWALDFLVHDYVLMPFLDRYVKTVPLASEILDVRKNQKLEMVKSLKIERARYLLEVEIGKSPPLSDDELWLELRHKAIELRDEWRLENRREFANIWSDIVYGIALFILIYFNKSKVALLKFTGYKLLNNITDSGKAFLIILITDIFLGYHSESGWQVLIEIILEHYGFEVDQAAITIFICFVPVVIDACVKLWLYKYLPRVSPNVTNIFREMKRH